MCCVKLSDNTAGLQAMKSFKRDENEDQSRFTGHRVFSSCGGPIPATFMVSGHEFTWHDH